VSDALSSELMEELSLFIGDRLGLSFPPDRWSDLASRLGHVARLTGHRDVPDLLDSVRSGRLDRAGLNVMASNLTVAETYFYRERASLQALERYVFPAIAAAAGARAGQLRVWSVGCASGEEPYTLAMIVSAFPGFQGWNVTIVGSDINPALLARAEAGLYTSWSFRGVPEEIVEKFFRKAGPTTWEILPWIRRMVSFEPINLAADTFPSLVSNTNAMDVILCRNVLMYFRPDIVPEVIRKLARSLRDGGWLVVSPVETALVSEPTLAPVTVDDAILHRKTGAASSPTASVVPQPPQTRADATACPRLPLGRQSPRGGKRPVPAPPPTAGASAREHANAGRLAEAEAVCVRAIHGDRLSAPLRLLHATILTELNRLPDAVAALRKALFLDPHLVTARLVQGALLLRLGRRDEARRQLSGVLDQLTHHAEEEMVPESDGMSVGRLREVTRSLLGERLAP
jgi:chemotaxis protein methyltransferase CheR